RPFEHRRQEQARVRSGTAMGGFARPLPFRPPGRPDRPCLLRRRPLASVGMRLGIVAWDCDEHESKHLGDVARALGHDALLFTLDDVRWARNGGVHGVLVRDQPASGLDVIVSRAQLRRERWQTDLEALTLLGSVPGTPILDPAAEFVAA